MSNPHVWIVRAGPGSQHAARVSQHAKASRRFHVILDCAREGLNLEQAAKAAGVTSSSARKLLYKRLGSTIYPPKELV